MEATSQHTSRIPRWFSTSVLLILLVPVATFILNHSTVHHLLLPQLQGQLGIELSGIHVRLVPPSVEVFDLVLRDGGNSQAVLRAPRASLSVRLWPLLTKRMRLLELSAVKPELVVQRDREGIWHVPLVDETPRTEPTTTADHKWVISDFQVVDGSILILDEERLAPDGVRIHHVHAAVECNQAHTQAELKLAGKTDDGGQLAVHGSMSLAKNVVPLQFEGTFHVQQVSLPYWFERARQSVPARSKELAWRGNLSAAIRLDFLPGTQGFNATISHVQADLGWLAIGGDAIIERAGTNHPVYAMSLSTSAVGSDTFFAHVPSAWVPKKVRETVDAHDVKGTVELVSVALRGSIDALREPDDWKIVAKLSHGSGVWGTQSSYVHELSARVEVDPHRANVTDFSGEANGVRITSTKLTVSDLDLGPSVEAHLLGVGNIEHMLAVLQQFDTGTAASSVTRNIANLRGTLHLAVDLAGPIFPKPAIRLVKAEVRVQDLALSVADHYAIEQLNGNVEADSRILGVRHIQGVMQGIRFDAQGTVDIEAGGRMSNFTLHMQSDGTAVRDLLTTKFGVRPDIHIGGQARAVVSLSGTTGAVHCRSIIDLTESELIIPAVLHKHKGVPGRLELEGNILDGKRVMVEDLKLVLFEHQIHASGEVELNHKPKFHVQVKSSPISLRTLADIGVRMPLTEGILETSAMVSGEGTDWTSWTPSGWITVRGGVVTLPGLEDKLSEVSGRLRVTPRGAVLDELFFKIGESDVKLTGIVEQWRHHPRATLMVESSRFDVAKILPKPNHNSAPTNENLQDWIQPKETTVAFMVKQLQYERLVLRTVSGEIRVDPRKVQVNELRGETLHGRLFGRGEARLGSRQRMDVDAELEVDGIPAQDLLSMREGEAKTLEGTLSLNGVMQATVDGHTPIWNTLSTARHGFTIKILNGRLQQDPVLTKVLTILNIPAVLIGQVDLNHDGIPFHSLTARVVARDGLFSSEDIVLDSPIIKVTGAGTADARNNGLNLALAVSPLAAYSDLVGKIPLFGPLLGGDRPGLSTALFEAKGSLGDPVVSYLPLESLGRGLTGYPRLAIDVLLNTMRLPHTAFAYAAD